ncbi:MAG: CotH kinase family protein, partial [Treponema sp.]|nr:CotH kinase family protein [Treponema sp.]
MKKIIFPAIIFGILITLAVFFAACPVEQDQNARQNRDSNAALEEITVNGEPVPFGQPSGTVADAAVGGTLSLSFEKAQSVTITLTAASDAARTEYSKLSPGDDTPLWKESGTLAFNNGDFLIIAVWAADKETVLYYRLAVAVEEPPDDPDPPPDNPLLGKALILQTYGTGSKTDGGVSHSFIELYNKSDEALNLDGYSLQYSTGAASWKMLDLSGKTIPAEHSFLVMGKQVNNQTANTGRLQLAEADADLIWQDGTEPLQIDNNAYKIVLVKTLSPLTVSNPFNTNGGGKKCDGYVDLLGTNDSDETKNIDGFEGNAERAPFYASKGKSVRRVDLQDTDDNAHDFERVEWRLGQVETISQTDFAALKPRGTQDGPWDPVHRRENAKSSDASLSAVSIAGTAAESGAPAAQWNEVSAPGSVTISGLLAHSAIVTLTPAAGAAYRTARVTGGGAPVWDAAPAYNFSSGDFLYIEVTAEDGRARQVYKIVVTVTQATGAVISGAVSLELNTTFAQSAVVVEAYRTQAAASGDLISRTNANVSTGQYSLQIPPGGVWFKIVVTDETGYTFGKVVSTSAKQISGDESGVNLTLGGFSPPELTAFTLLNASASGGTKQNKTGTIDQSSGVITLPATSFATVNANTVLEFHKLAANFTLSAGSALYVGDTAQVSGTTTNDYYQPVTFTVRAEDNARKTYTVAGPAAASVAGTTSFQTQGFPILIVNTTDKTTGLPTGGNSTKLNIVWNTTGAYTYYGPDGTIREGGVDIKGHGNYSVRHDTKKSYSLKFHEKTSFPYYDYQTNSYVDLPAHKRWTLLAHPNDSASRVRTTTGFELGRVLDNMGWQPHAEHVYFFLNGTFTGFYIMSEAIKIDPGRLAIGNEGWIVEMNNTWWYSADTQNNNSTYIFDSLYNFMTSHKNPVINRSGHDGAANSSPSEGIVWSWSDPDELLGWYEPDPPLGSGSLTYTSNSNFPRKGIVLYSELDGAGPNSKLPAEWKLPVNMYANTMAAGTTSLASVYPEYQNSRFVQMARFIQDAEDAFYRHDYSEATGYRKYIDIDAFIDWQIATELCSNWEILAVNGSYMYFDPAAGKLKMGPVWDLDQGWQGSNGAIA